MEEFSKLDTSLLLTPASPHTPPKGVPGVFDQTRGPSDCAQELFSQAAYTPELKCVCIATRYIHGTYVFENSYEESEYISADCLKEMFHGTAVMTIFESTSCPIALGACIVGLGRKQVCGGANIWGYGVVPEESGCLEDDLNISLDGAYDCPLGSMIA